ncbi:MAG: hypothetical protein FWB78_04985 [Treponema sp.]|nr:hypothetical protein [Treponema sp.]
MKILLEQFIGIGELDSGAKLLLTMQVLQDGSLDVCARRASIAISSNKQIPGFASGPNFKIYSQPPSPHVYNFITLKTGCIVEIIFAKI